MLCAVKRNRDFVDWFLAEGRVLGGRQMELLGTIRRLYVQQKEMFDERKRRVEERTAGIAHQFLRPVVRGKAKAQVDVGVNYDVSVDGNETARLERASFDAYSECTVLKDVVERYRERRTGSLSSHKGMTMRRDL